jgi:ADP-ribose pyrophosphatase
VGRQDTKFETTVRRESLYQGNYLHLERFHVVLPDGRATTREIVRVSEAVAVLPLDEHGFVHLVRQRRPAIEETILEVPAGIIDPGETPENAAIRECEEETGFRPTRLTKLIRYAHAEGYSTGFTTLYLGTELEEGGPLRLDSTEFLENVPMLLGELLALVHENQIIDSKTILCAFLTERLLHDQKSAHSGSAS